MIKKIYSLLISIFIFCIPITILKISNEINTKKIKINQNIGYRYDINKPIGKIIIKKININNDLYAVESPKNNIEENITILEDSITPDKENSIMIIAAHSGTGNVAYFEELDKLNINDEITIIYYNKKYNYIVKNIWEEKKVGYINVNKENKKQLILTTCSPKREKYQLIVNCTEKESK